MSKDELLICETCGTQITHIIKECRHLYEQERTNLNLTKTLDEILGPNKGQNMKTITFLKLAKIKYNRNC